MARGGRERQLATIFNHSAHYGLENKILIFNKKKSDYLSEYSISEEDVFYLKEKGTIGRLKEVKRILKQFEPDIIYAWGGFEVNFCFLLSPFTKAKIINGSIRHGIIKINKKHLSRLFFLHLSKYIVANSRAGLRANKLSRGYVLYNGIDKKFSGKFSDEEKRKILTSVFNDYKGEPVIISVANLVPYKDYFTVFKSLNDLKEKGCSFRFMAVGEGPMRNQLEIEIASLKLTKEVILLGRTAKVQQYLKAADLFVHSSEGEGCSNAILEAMAAGLPVIASNTGGTSEITGFENGQLFEYRNTIQLTKALETHLTDPDMMLQKGKRSSQIIEDRFTVERMTANYISILNRIRS
jgi:glycosyltransferase involved in cell wall biosynthesis